KAEESFRVTSRNLDGQARDFALQLIKPRSFERADGDDGRPAGIEKRPVHKVFYLQPDDVQRFLVYEIGFGNYGDPAGDGEQAADFKMLASLRLDGFIGGNHQQHPIHAAYPSEHVSHNTFAAGDIDEAQAQLFAVRRGQLQVSKAEIDSDAAPLLFFQPVGIDAGKGPHQRGFTVVDVAGRAEDDGFHSRLV